MSESSSIGNGLNVRNSGTDELRAGRLRNSADWFVIEDGWIVAQTIHYGDKAVKVYCVPSRRVPTMSEIDVNGSGGTHAAAPERWQRSA